MGLQVLTRRTPPGAQSQRGRNGAAPRPYGPVPAKEVLALARCGRSPPAWASSGGKFTTTPGAGENTRHKKLGRTPESSLTAGLAARDLPGRFRSSLPERAGVLFVYEYAARRATSGSRPRPRRPWILDGQSGRSLEARAVAGSRRQTTRAGSPAGNSIRTTALHRALHSTTPTPCSTSHHHRSRSLPRPWKSALRLRRVGEDAPASNSSSSSSSRSFL